MIEQKYINEVLDKIKLTDLMSDYGIHLEIRGSRAWCCCPFHQEKTASFSVDLEKNRWRCYGCGKGGDVINFVMDKENLTFPLAVRRLLERLGISLSDETMQSTPEEEAGFRKLESMHIINEKLCTFFYEEMQKDTADAKAAKGYMLSRWNEEYCNEMRIGYAPNDRTSVIDYARTSGLDIDLMLEMGILKMSEKTHSPYCVYRNRLMIPIKEKYHNIEGFTARALDKNATCKYLNSSNSELYHKSESIFGIDRAVTKARVSGKMYLVEGAPDVMKLQSLGIPNAIASLGGSWSEKQFQMLIDYGLKECTLCFIPDSDVPHNGEQLGAGFKNVMRNGEIAMKQGFTVSVMEIPNDLSAAQPKKIDPDEFFNEKTDMEKLCEREFLIWAFKKRFDKDATAEEKQKLIKDTCEKLLFIKDKALRERYIEELAKVDGKKTIWKQALQTIVSNLKKPILHRADVNGIVSMESYGFTEKQGSYWGIGKEKTEEQWSNFTLKPLLHIKDYFRPVRIFSIKNDLPDSKEEIIELDMEKFTSSKAFHKYVIGIGNYTWFGNETALMKLQCYMAMITETAVEIKQLGWQKEGFYAFSNGVWEDGEWYDVDEMGIVRLKSGVFYLPAMSKLYEDFKTLYANERKFCHLNTSDITPCDYFRKITIVFGKNGIVGLCFYLATLFRDIVVSKTHFFPLLNIFGPMGSGKTQLGETLVSFFMAENKPLNIGTSTLPALSDYVASVSNALVHIDEYKNSLEISKIEFIKNLWDGIGRSRMNMEKDKKREQAKVDSGIILTGQEMPTADIALFSRLLFLTNERQDHNWEERARFNDLLRCRRNGATHITLKILEHRTLFEDQFDDAWRQVEEDVDSNTKGQIFKDRIKDNWLVPLAAFLAIEKVVDFPFTYKELLKTCVDGMIRQNDLCSATDEIACFWTIFSGAQQKGELKQGQDYLIKSKKQIKTNKFKDGLSFEPPKRILMIRKNSTFATYQKFGGQINSRLLPTESMIHYLNTSPGYLGTAASPERFRQLTNYGTPVSEQSMENGKIIVKEKKFQDRPLCFEYEVVCKKYGINLDSNIEDDK